MKLTSQENDEILNILENRFSENMIRHKTLKWNEIEERLKNNPVKLWSLHQMEKTGGEPDVVDFNSETGEYIFFDCSKESPQGRRSTCYDQDALESRKKFKPKNSAMNMAKEMGIEMLTEEEYRKLQSFGSFDNKTSSWLKTPKEIRKLGGAIFGDFRYDQAFIYHNSAESYYASRSFRGSLKV